MSAHAPVGGKFVTGPAKVLMAITGRGFAIIIWRFIAGLGPVTVAGPHQEVPDRRLVDPAVRALQVVIEESQSGLAVGPRGVLPERQVAGGRHLPGQRRVEQLV